MRFMGLFIVGFIFYYCGDAWAEGADKIASLDSVGPFAGLATAIAIAYAGLPNYRHRIRVRDRINIYVQKRNLIENLLSKIIRESIIKKDNKWAFLYVYGAYDDHRPDISHLAPDIDTSRQHDGLPYVQAYRTIYHSNIDKVLALVLGIISSTVLWFSAFDDVHFFEQTMKNQLKYRFVVDVQAFYMLCVPLSIFFILMYYRYGKSSRVGHFSKGEAFLCLLSLIIFGSMICGTCFDFGWYAWLANIITPTENLHMFRVIDIALIAAVSLPGLLLLLGNYLSAKIIEEAQKCVDDMANSISDQVADVTLKVPEKIVP